MMMTLENLQFAKPMPRIEAFNTLRGKVIKGNNYSQFNLCDYTGDDGMDVIDSRMLLCMQLGIDLDRLIMPRQTHTANVAVIDRSFITDSIEHQEQRLQNVDALVTTLKNVCIGVNTADCVNIALADPEAGIIAAVHAGWKGTAARIAAAAVKQMLKLGATAANIQASLGAAICRDCFEVGDEVVDHFVQCGLSPDAIMMRNAATGKAHIDLKEANRLTLMECGVPQANIVVSANCTRCNHDKYFSARRLGINSGRMFTGIIMR